MKPMPQHRKKAYKAIESVRQRVPGLSPFAIARGMSQTDLRKLIRNERRIELAFEDHRFWDPPLEHRCGNDQ